MGAGNRIEIDIAEDPAEAEKVLALQPAGGSPLEDPHGQLVFSRCEKGCQVKFRGGKAVLAVADIVPVAPEGETALHALEGDDERTSLLQQGLHGLRKGKIFHIGSRGIKMFRDLTGNDILAAVPWILIIDIGRDIIAFHLDMGRDPYVRPCTAVIGGRLEAGRRVRRLIRIGKLPQTVQGTAKNRVSGCSRGLLSPSLQLRFICKKDMVRVRRKAVLLKDGRI